MMEENKTSFATLQHLLKQSYSDNPDDQQKAAIALAKTVEGTVFPAVSFGPLAHAICRLIPSKNRTVVSYSAKALKCLILDDALRPQVIVAGVPAIVCEAINVWKGEVLCLRELLGTIQTLTWDKQCLKSVCNGDLMSQLLEFSRNSDQEVSVLALATLANILSYADTILLSNNVILEVLGAGLPTLLDMVRQVQNQRPQRFYAAAALANSSSHPRLASILNQHGALQLFRELERQSLASLHLLGSRLGDCASTSVYFLSDRKEGDPHIATSRFRFKWGTTPVMEISLAPYHKYAGTLWCCFAAWLLLIGFTFSPLLRAYMAVSISPIAAP